MDLAKLVWQHQCPKNYEGEIAFEISMYRAFASYLRLWRSRQWADGKSLDAQTRRR